MMGDMRGLGIHGPKLKFLDRDFLYTLLETNATTYNLPQIFSLVDEEYKL
jgi:hypothetical protein